MNTVNSPAPVKHDGNKSDKLNTAPFSNPKLPLMISPTRQKGSVLGSRKKIVDPIIFEKIAPPSPVVVAQQDSEAYDQIYWRRKTSRPLRRKSKATSDFPPPPPSQTPSSVSTRRQMSPVVRVRKRSSSRPRQRSNSFSSLDQPKEVEPKEASSLNDSESSLGDFGNSDEAISSKRRGKRPTTTPRPDSTHDHPALDNNNSLSSTSLNSSEGSLVSSCSSISSGSKPILQKRKGHATRTAKLRQQMREQQKAEKPKRHNSAPRGLTGLTRGAPSPRPEQTKRSHSQTMTPKAASRRSLVSVSSSEATLDVKPSSSKALDVPGGLPRKTTSRGPSMRNLLRNKRKLEREIHQSDVFRYVLHKCPLEDFQQQPSMISLGTTGTSSTQQQSDPPSHSQPSPVPPQRSDSGSGRKKRSPSTPMQPLHHKMPLDRFLEMRYQSEAMATQLREPQYQKEMSPRLDGQDQPMHMRSHQPQELNETWHDANSLDTFSTRHKRDSVPGEERVEDLFKRLEAATLVSKEEKVQGQSSTDNGDESFISLDWTDLPSTWKHDTKGGVSATTNTCATSGLTEDFQSQTLSISLDDMPAARPQDGDNAGENESLENSACSLGALFDDDKSAGAPTAQEEVTNFAIVDCSGHHCLYSGTISTSTSMPNGMGRLEYTSRGEVFVGRFVHGIWSGYGTCHYALTQEEYTGFFDDYIRHGHGTTNFSDGRVFEGTYHEGAKVEGKMTYADQSIYVGKFDNGARNGRGTYTFANGAVFFGDFYQDEISSGILTYPNGSRFRGRWKNGVRHGPGKEFHPDGSVGREGTWNEGQLVS